MGRGFRKLIVAAVAVCLATTSVPMQVNATGSTQQQIDQAQQNKSELEDIIEAHEKELKSLKGEQSALEKKLDELNEQLVEVSNRLADLEEQIVAKKDEIEVTQNNLAAAKEKEAWQYACMKQHIKYTYERGEMDWLDVLFRAESFSGLLNYITYFESVADYSDKILEDIIASREFIESEEARLEQEKLDLEVLKLNAEAEQSKVKELIEQASESIDDYEDQIEDAEAAALAYEKEMKKLESNLVYLKRKLAEEIAWAEAAAKGTWRDASDITYAEGDLYLLANLIYCEAGGEPYEGKLAVGAVVINRVRSEKFPDTVVGVIYQKNQFSPAGSGRLALALEVNKATAQCYQAAQEAMAGTTNVGGCLFFRTPVEGLTGISIGGHIFY